MEKKNLEELLKKEQEALSRSKDGTSIIELAKNDSFSIAYGELSPGESNKEHQLEMQELYYFLEGEGELMVDGKKELITKGTMITVPPKAKQKLTNTGKGRIQFLMIVSPPYNPTKEEILEK